MNPSYEAAMAILSGMEGVKLHAPITMKILPGCQLYWFDGYASLITTVRRLDYLAAVSVIAVREGVYRMTPIEVDRTTGVSFLYVIVYDDYQLHPLHGTYVGWMVSIS
jgi:hypothetical protein